tara:strand:- start:535 stop:684 length:150 start_codon:yes stop_codon:yes gene_type:complete
MKLLLWPGDFVASLAGLPKDSDNRQILRMWANTVIWAVVSSLILVLVLT